MAEKLKSLPRLLANFVQQKWDESDCVCPEYHGSVEFDVTDLVAKLPFAEALSLLGSDADYELAEEMAWEAGIAQTWDGPFVVELRDNFIKFLGEHGVIKLTERSWIIIQDRYRTGENAWPPTISRTHRFRLNVDIELDAVAGPFASGVYIENLLARVEHFIANGMLTGDGPETVSEYKVKAGPYGAGRVLLKEDWK